MKSLTLRTFAVLVALALLAAAMPPNAAYAHHWDDDDDDEEIWGYVIMLILIGATSPFWLPWTLMEEPDTLDLDTRFHEYPYKDGAEGFISLEKGDRRASPFWSWAAASAARTTGSASPRSCSPTSDSPCTTTRPTTT